MINILSLLLLTGFSPSITKEALEAQVSECGLSLSPVKDRYGTMPDASVYFQDDLPGVRLNRNKVGNDCIVKWLKANIPAYIVVRANPEL